MRKCVCLFLVSLFLTGCFGWSKSPLTAAVRPEPGEFSLVTEWVFLNPILDNGYYATVGADSLGFVEKPTRLANNLCFHSGFRLQAMYVFCDPCSDVRFAWTRMHSTNTENASDPFVQPQKPSGASLLPDGFAKAKTSFDFDRVEALYGIKVWQNCHLSLVLEGGVQYVDIGTVEDDQYGDIPGIFPVTYNLKADYWGVGPQFGFDMSYCLCGGFSITGNINGALLIGESKAHLQTEVFLLDGFSNETLWRIVPAGAIRVGIDYQFCWCCDWALGAGYEFYSYTKALNNPILLENLELLEAGLFIPIIDTYSNAALHGPYLSIQATF